MKDRIITENILNRIRSLQENSNNEQMGSIAITNSPRFGQNVLQTQEDAFKNAVDGGAQFADENENDPNSNPLVYIVGDGAGHGDDLIFSGTIPGKNNLKFQFRLKDSDGDGCFIWADGLRLTDENVRTLFKIQGYYRNWRDEWQSEGKMLSMLGKSSAKETSDKEQN